MIAALNSLADVPRSGPWEDLEYADMRLLGLDPRGSLAILSTLPIGIQESFRGLLVLARALEANRDLATADELYRHIEARSAKNPRHLLMLAELHTSRYNPERAAAILEGLPREWQEGYSGQLVLANILIERHQGTEALALSESLIAQRPTDIEARSLKGQSLLLLRRFEDALTYYQALVEERPARDDLRQALAQALMGCDRVEEAMAIAEDVRDQSDRQAGLRLTRIDLAMAEILMMAERTEEALPLVDGVLALLPNSRHLLKTRAEILDRLGRYDEAQESLDRIGVPAEHASLDEQILGASLARWTQNFAASRAAYERIVQANPNLVDALGGLASLLADWPPTRGESLPYFRRILEIEPRSLYRVAYASTLRTLGHQQAALDELHQFESMQGGHRDSRILRSQLLFDRGKTREALDVLKELEHRRPGDPEVDVALAFHYARLGSGYRASMVDFLRTARTKGPRRLSVRRGVRQLLNPQGQAYSGRLSSSDTLQRKTQGLGVSDVMGRRFQGDIQVEHHETSRFGIRSNWTDAQVDANWNVHDGHDVGLSNTIGDGGSPNTQLQPGVSWKWTGLGAIWGRVSASRSWVADSPEALLAGLEQTTFRIEAGREVGRLRGNLSFDYQDIDDGNTRRVLTLDTRYRVGSRVDLIVDGEIWNSAFNPIPFNLYFAPLRYQSLSAGVEWFALVGEAFEASLRAQALRDSLEGDPGTGSLYGVRAVRNMGNFARAYLDYSHLRQSATRRLGAGDVFDLDSLQIGYEGSF